VSGDDVARLCIASHVTLGQRARESKPSETSEGEKAVRRRRAILSSDATAISLAVEGGTDTLLFSRLHSLILYPRRPTARTRSGVAPSDTTLESSLNLALVRHG
jgi:hypothetical protein